jgi:hypothetical protein
MDDEGNVSIPVALWNIIALNRNAFFLQPSEKPQVPCDQKLRILTTMAAK